MKTLNEISTDGKSVEDAYLLEAQKAVDIVNDGVEKGSYSELSQRLDKLPSVGINRGKAVFTRRSSAIYIWIVAICVVLTCIYLSYLPVLVGTIVYSDDFDSFGFIGSATVALAFILNVIIGSRAIAMCRFNRRYDLYIKDLRFKNIELIDDLAAYSKIETEKIVSDLNKAVKMKLIPQGHFGRDNIIFITNNEVYETYKSKQAVYDRYYRKQIEERLRMKERTKEIQDILKQGQGYVDKIHESNVIIKDKIISQKLDRMENVVSMIFHEVDINPQHAEKLEMFMNYYLPTTEKLLEAYMEIDEKKIKRKSSERTKKDIEGAIDKLIESFEGLLDKFYQEKELDISTDISAMEILMKQDGLTE